MHQDILLHELSPNTLFLHSINKNMAHVINFKKNTILVEHVRHLVHNRVNCNGEVLTQNLH